MDEPLLQPPPKKRRLGLKIFLWSLFLLAGAAVVVPYYAKARITECKNACINNLRQIDGAKEQWALEAKTPDGEPVDELKVDEYIKGGRPKCPENGVYNYNRIGSPPTCSVASHTL